MGDRTREQLQRSNQMQQRDLERCAARVARLREMLRLYATATDCPVCYASPRMVDVDVETLPSGNQIHRGGRWHVEHGLSCDVGRALEQGRHGMICRHRRAWLARSPRCPSCGAPLRFCSVCNGNGLLASLNYDTCPSCHGSGLEVAAPDEPR